MKAQTPGTPGRGQARSAAIGRVFALILIGAAFGAVLLGVAGRLDWVEGWILAGVFMLYLGGGGIIGIIIDPEQLNERGGAISSARGRERMILFAVVVLCIAAIVVAALDAGRFRWSRMPIYAKLVGWLLLLPAVALPMWVGVVNTYASVVVRIQSDRGHCVITNGPYRLVRHPMYVGAILMGISIPLALGSYWALLPGLAFSIGFALRTAQEDAVLIHELAGYAEYANKVRYRLLPGVW